MKTIVITGGTDGMGKALGLGCLERGDRVIALGSDAVKGQRLRLAADRLGAGERFEFIRSDLSLVAENHRAIAALVERLPVIDALVLGARYYRSSRFETVEGIEHNFALFYLSRYLLGHGLVERLNQAHRPVIMNLAGPGTDLSGMNWDDLEFTRGYRPDKVMAQCGKLADLLAVAFTDSYPDSRIRYVLVHPGLTATGFAGEYSQADAEVVAGMRERGQPVEAAVAMLRRHLDSPDPEPLSAYMQHTKVPVTGEPFDVEAARRLARLTRVRLAETRPSPEPPTRS